MRSLRKWRTLSPEEKRLAAEAFPLLIAIRLALWVLPFRVIQRQVDSARARAARKTRASPLPAPIIGNLVSRLARSIPGATCLTQALSAQILLARHGHPSALRFGAKQANGKFEAHAWVESGGETIIGARPPQEFAKFQRVSKRSA